MKKRMSILIVVLLVLILIFSSFANAYANPIAQFVGSQMGRTAMTTVISGMLIKDFTDATMVTWDSVMELVDVTKWYIGKHTGGYGLSIPKEDLIAMTNEIVNQLGGYGNLYKQSMDVPGLITPYTVINMELIEQYRYSMATLRSLIDNSVISTFAINGDPSRERNHEIFKRVIDGVTEIGYTMEWRAYGDIWIPEQERICWSIPYNTYYSYDDAVVTNIPIPSETWNSDYITETGPNFDGWMEQPGNRYIVNVPTTTDGLGNLIVDDVALANQTPDLARVNDRLTELQELPVNDVETWNPVPPTTNPVTDPITDVASESWLDRLWSKFVDLFVLPDDYFIKNFQYLKNEVPMMAFPLQIISDIERMASLSGGYLDDIWADGWGGHHKIVDFQFLRDMLPTFHNFLRGIMFILLLMYNYDQVYKLIRGNSYGFGNSRQEIIPQQIESPFKSLGRS